MTSLYWDQQFISLRLPRRWIISCSFCWAQSIVFFLALVLWPAAAAETPPSTDSPWQRAQQEARTLWERSRAIADDWWQRSRAVADQTLSGAREMLAPEDHFAQLWNTTLPKLERGLALQEEARTLPASSWWQRDRRAVAAELDRLLDETVAILSTSPLQRYRARIAELRAAQERARAEIAEYRQARIAAPTQSTLKRTVADYERLIAERQATIAAQEDELREIKRVFAAELRQIGLDVSDEQLDVLLATVVGDQLVDLGIVFDQVKTLALQLERLVQESGEDLTSARRYYGLYVILLRALAQMHRTVEQAIASGYLPQIEEIAAQARALREETRALQHSHPERAEILAANLAAQDLTLEAAGLYRDYLREQEAQVRAAREQLDRDIQTAQNTYETVRVSGELLALVKSSQKLLASLSDRQVPALRPFRNLELKREFEQLTARLRSTTD